jgi:SAM-dependent methyltransferase
VTVRKLAAVAVEGKVYGIDHSEQSVAAARRTNRQEIAAGRVEIRQAAVSGLPFSDGLFDVVTAVETHYFWPDLHADMREVLRVLKPGGTLVIVAEAYKGGKHDERLQRVAELTKMVFLTPDEHRELFSTAGYSDVRVTERPDKGWICAIGRKPSLGADHEPAGRAIREAFGRR